MDPHERWIHMSVLEKEPVSQDRERAQLEAQISALGADVAQLDDLLPQFAKPLFPKRLLLQPNPVVTGMPNPSDFASSVSAPPQLFGLPKGRSAVAIGSRKRSPDNITFEAPSTVLFLPRMRRRVIDGYGMPALFNVTSKEYTKPHCVSNGPLAPNGLPVPIQSTITIPIPSNAPVFNNLPGPSNPHDPSLPTKQQDRDVLTKLPKSLLYDGQSNWFVFQTKFERYARVQDWSDAECADCLGWCLTGKAVDFYALLTEGRGTVLYAELMQRLEERFGAKELPATAQGRFQVAHQASGESLEDWSDAGN
ncbi:hypothetical protein DPMN_120050 [Dreissena polymorpha]|uniref:Uncharacterized protein n=1 Tax=Dreissena polymorpha TaxID=45954 RepID=A0A9D4GN36_DREPO|nr:hypothetical protein DPMN_120050 [Dreissena polymorpha]